MVIGGAGFIGSHLVDRLLAEQHVVDVVDDLSSGGLANLAHARSLGADLKIHHLDVCADEFGSLVAMRSPDVIYHLGWLPPGRATAAGAGRAVHGMLNVVDAAATLPTAKIVTTVDGAAWYGEVPLREQPIKEGRSPEPMGWRGVVTRAVVELLVGARRDHEIEFTALALGAVYGPRQRADGGVVAAFATAWHRDEAPVVHGDGRQSRDFVFVDDTVDACVRAATRGGGLVVNVGTGTPTSIRDLWATLAGHDAAVPLHAASDPASVQRLALSPTRARIHLSWAPWTTLADGLRATLAAP